MGEQNVLAEALVVAAHQAIHRSAGQLGAQFLELIGDGERHQAGAGRQQVVAELLGHLIAKTGGTKSRDRQAAGGNHQRFARHLPKRRVEQITFLKLLDGLDRRVQVQADADLIALVQQHFEDVAGFVIAKQLAEFFLVVGHAVLGDHADEIPLGIAGQGRFAEVRVLREKIARFGVHVGEIAAATARHQDFLAGLVGMVEQQHLAPAPGGGQCTHQPCGASANDHDFGRAQNSVLRIENP
ncbi:hypothetical protein D3C73_781970 [compost metagenome]